MPLKVTDHPEGSFSVEGECTADRAEVWIDDYYTALAIGMGDGVIFLKKDEAEQFAELIVAFAKKGLP